MLLINESLIRLLPLVRFKVAARVGFDLADACLTTRATSVQQGSLGRPGIRRT